MALGRTALLAPLLRWASQRRYPTLLVVTVGLFVLNLAVPDAIPLADEAIMALTALVLARLRKPDEGDGPAAPPGPKPPPKPAR
jgi:hypothetical protein